MLNNRKEDLYRKEDQKEFEGISPIKGMAQMGQGGSNGILSIPLNETEADTKQFGSEMKSQMDTEFKLLNIELREIENVPTTKLRSGDHSSLT